MVLSIIPDIQAQLTQTAQNKVSLFFNICICIIIEKSLTLTNLLACLKFFVCQFEVSFNADTKNKRTTCLNLFRKTFTGFIAVIVYDKIFKK